ncbi:MAG: cation diffusion facilitator family transporter [Holosporales bacterium]|jgi:ferrous-iron efflux pump FieF|nr:cation diffusion facilitator family transporter [Holosporales bacterium]
MFCCSECKEIFEKSQKNNRLLIKEAVFYVFLISLLIVSCRLIAYLYYNSVAVKAVFFDSVKDCFVSLLNIAFIWFSTKAADDRYQFGYGKFESLASLFQAILLIAMSGNIVWGNFSEHSHHNELSQIAITALLISLVFLIAMAFIQTYYSKKIKSHALKADSAHYKADIAMNITVIVCFFTSKELPWVDATIGLGIAIYFLIIAFFVGKAALSSLLDKSLPNNIKQKIYEIIANTGITDTFIMTKSIGRNEFILVNILYNRLLSKPISSSKVEGAHEAQNRSVLDIHEEHWGESVISSKPHEDSSIEATNKFAEEIELRKESNEECILKSSIEKQKDIKEAIHKEFPKAYIIVTLVFEEQE